MIFSNTSNYMLKYQKAKAKLVEYDIPQKDYPKFPLNSNELSYPVVYILSRYAESVIENNVADMEEFSPHLVAASQYFDAAVGANDRAEYDVDFLLSGAASYFLSDDFGSAKVLCSEYFARINPETNEPQKIMGNFLGYLLLNRDFHISEDTPDGEQVCRSLLAYYNTGEGAEEIQSLLSEYRKAIYENDAPMEIYYVDILCAIVMVALSKSSWILLPRYSELDQSLWSDYLKSPKAPRMLWPAQQLIGEKGVLRGQSAIVQLPTGVGKTKSIELVIRSSFASGRATTAIIVAPLRALCNEIAKALRLVVCTSTLAQGVNIPIKYLFMTSFMVARNSMRIRSFQNLMGRTARSGMYTEGSVIVTDPRLFDNKNNRKNGGNYKWNECIKMFDDSAAEPCGSSILSLVQDIRIDYETRVIGAKVAQHIIDHYNEPDCFEQYVNKLTTALHKAYAKRLITSCEYSSGVSSSLKIRSNRAEKSLAYCESLLR